MSHSNSCIYNYIFIVELIKVNTKRPTNNTAKISWVLDSKQQEQFSKDGVKGQFIVRYEVDRASESKILVSIYSYIMLQILHPHLPKLNSLGIFCTNYFTYPNFSYPLMSLQF